MIAVVFWVFCTVARDTRATKFGLSWLFLPKLTDKLLSSGLIGLVMLLSWYPVVFWETLDFCGTLMVIFIVYELRF